MRWFCSLLLELLGLRKSYYESRSLPYETGLNSSSGFQLYLGLKQVEKGWDHRPRNSAWYEQVVELFSQRQKGHRDKSVATAGFMIEINHQWSGNFEIIEVDYISVVKPVEAMNPSLSVLHFLQLGSYFKFMKRSISLWYQLQHFNTVVMTPKYQHDTLAWLKICKRRGHLPEYSFFFGQIQSISLK